MSLAADLGRSIAGKAIAALPGPLRQKVLALRHGWKPEQLEQVVVANPASAEVRLLIAPVNSAAQAKRWADAASTLPGVSAQNLAFGVGLGAMSRNSDQVVEKTVGEHSYTWAAKQRAEILKGFTHILYESEHPILGGYYGGDLEAEVQDLRKHGLRVAMLSHGSDARLPSEHAKVNQFSPFKDETSALFTEYQGVAERNQRLLKTIDAPVFVSTPDMFHYLPQASWLPIIVDESGWIDARPVNFADWKPVVLHVPSNSALKGTQHIRPAMNRLAKEGLIEYVEASGIPYEDMPALVERADVVIDQLGMGAYGVATVEALLAGRIVVAEVGDFARKKIRETTGWDSPVVQADPDTIYDVVKEIALNPDAYRDLPEAGRKYAQDVHSPGRAAQALAPFLST